MTRVLVVDDHPMWRDAVARDLGDAGFDVVAALGEGARVAAVAAATGPDVVVLDLQLPDVSDDEFASSLGELGRLAKTLGLDVVGRVTQKRSHLATGTVVGEGKLAELARWTGGKGVVPDPLMEAARTRQPAAANSSAAAVPTKPEPPTSATSRGREEGAIDMPAL